jgi:maltose alpha-D-glucosyltransferase/alpha-amylase
MTPPAGWLAGAVIYEIYPESFADSNGDGIGDFPGVIAHLDHLQWLGVNTIWFNPCFASPFVDAGYDVSDYLQVAPRYGTNEDLVRLVAEARARGIRVLLDLVAGHTSDQHAWFQAELHADGPDPLGDRYIWSDRDDGERLSASAPGQSPWVPSPGPRPGFYLKNFYDEQPALNFGYATLRDGERWREPVDAPGPQRNVQALKDIMAFWIDRGVAGFRVDMAFSLVKFDPGFTQTLQLWRGLADWLHETYPETVLIPEGSEPRGDLPTSFDADFFLVIHREHASLFNNGGAGVLPWYPPAPCFFDADGQGSTAVFLQDWDEARAGRDGRPIILATADHDFSRLVCGTRDAEQLGAAYTFLLTWGSVPSIYYGDEIGQRFLPGLPQHEGSIVHAGYNRAGCRTPMQWDGTANAGFSTAADPAELYLPIDPDPGRPTVAAQRADPDSTLHLVRRLLELRREVPALGGRAETVVLHRDYPFTYRRGDRHLVVVNPRREPARVELADVGPARALLSSGAEVRDGAVEVAGFGYGIFELLRD